MKDKYDGGHVCMCLFFFFLIWLFFFSLSSFLVAIIVDECCIFICLSMNVISVCDWITTNYYKWLAKKNLGCLFLYFQIAKNTTLIQLHKLLPILFSLCVCVLNSWSFYLFFFFVLLLHRYCHIVIVARVLLL